MGSDARSAGGALALLMLATFMGTGKGMALVSLARGLVSETSSRFCARRSLYCGR